MYYLMWTLLLLGLMVAPGEAPRDATETEQTCCDPPPPCPPDCGDSEDEGYRQN